MMNRPTTRWHRKPLAMWLLAGSVGAGALALAPAPAIAIDETKALADDKVPQAVLTTARANFLDATDVQYRMQEEGKNLYQINYTVPGNVRLQLILDEKGAMVAGPRLAPNQPNNAPGQKAQEKALAGWQARVQQVAEARSRENIPPAPPAQPAPGNLPLTTPPADTAEVPASALPAAVAKNFQRLSADARQAHYYRLGTGADTVYQMIYTTAAGDRREITLNEQGREVAGARPIQQQPSGVELTWEQIPPLVQKTLLPLTGRDRNAKYYKITKKEGISYGALYEAKGREMWVRVGENGDPIVDPKLAEAGGPDGEPQQAAVKLSPEHLRDRVQFVDLPNAVQDRVLKETEGATEVINMTHRQGNRVVHHTVWTDRQGRRHEIYLNDRGDPVGPLN